MVNLDRNKPTDWGKDCKGPLGLKLRELWSSPDVNPVAKHVATALGVTRNAVLKAVRSYRLQRHPNFKDTAQNAGVRKRGSQQPKIARLWNPKTTLPPLSSLKEPE